MNKEYPDVSALTGLFQGIGEAIATRPQKTSTYTMTTSTPYARDDMIKNRDRIGTARQNLSDILKMREKPLYSIANALSAVPEQQGAGSWLSNLVRGFGAGATSHTNTMVDRAQKEYEAEMQDLAQILAYDRAMGETQTQSQTVGYTPMEYAGGKSSGAGQGSQFLATLPTVNKDLPKQWADSQTQGFIQQLLDAPDLSSGSKAVLRATQRPEDLSNRSALLQDTGAYVGLVTSLQRASGATASMMNSDKEGMRALSVLENPSGKTKEELAEAVFGVQKMVDRALLAQYGVPYFGVPLDTTYYGQSKSATSGNTGEAGDGKIIINRTTGERRIMRNGQWQTI